MVQNRKKRLHIITKVIAIMIICLGIPAGCADNTDDSGALAVGLVYADEMPEMADTLYMLLRKGRYVNTQYEPIRGADKEEYLKRHGAEDISPLCFPGQGETSGTELYFDKETGKGCGIKYVETEAGMELLGFEISGYDTDGFWSWNYPNPYSTKIAYGDESYTKSDRLPAYWIKHVTDYDESYEYDSEGRLCSYKVMGVVDRGFGNREKEEIFQVSFSYGEDGNQQAKTCLRGKTCLFNPYVAKNCVSGERVYSVCQEQYYAYDEWERLIYTDLSGEGEYYFCYEETSMEDSTEASMVPYAFLEVHPLFCSFNRLAKEDYSFMDVPKGGEEAFLRQAGLAKEDMLYEYLWRNESDDGIVWSHAEECLTVYYNKEKEAGCGYFAYPNEDFTDMRGFMFQGCEKIKLSEAKDPYGVFANHYTEGKPDIAFMPLEDMLQWESWRYECKYDKDRLVYVWMYGTGSDTERFYIYEDDNDTPTYCLNVVRGTNNGITLFEFVP